MNCEKVGNLIIQLRKEKGKTQKELANMLNVSDRTISKWERGVGCPDVSLLQDISNVLNINIEKLLSGNLVPNITDGGNIKKLKFYVCPSCDNMMTSTGNSEISCCGRKLSNLKSVAIDDQHKFNVQEVDDEFYITFQHEMSKSHFISFIAYITYNKVMIVKLYPEQAAEVHIPKLYGGQMFSYCSKHGLMNHGKIKIT